MKTLQESINRMKVLAGIHEGLRKELDQVEEMVVQDVMEGQLSPEEQQVVSDLTSLNEADEQGWIAKLRQYAQKGLLTASVIAALLAAPNLSQAQKAAVKQASSGTEMAQQQVRDLSTEERMNWNKFIDWMQEKGFQGNEQMNHDKTLGLKYLAQFGKETGIHIDPSVIPSVQAEMQKVQGVNASFLSSRGDSATASKIASHVSPTDNWIGTKTSYFKFPSVSLRQVNNPSVQDKDLGLLKGDATTTGGGKINATSGASQQQQASLAGSTPGAKFTSDGTHQIIPKGSKIEKLADGTYYQDPNSGDMVRVVKPYYFQ